MKLKSVLLTALLSFAITPLAMAMSAEDHYLRGKELICYDNDTAYEHLEIACNKKYVKACVYGYKTGMDEYGVCTVPLHNPYHTIDNDRVFKLADKACKLGHKEACGLVEKIRKEHKEKERKERIREIQEERNVNEAEAELQFEEEKKYGKEKAAQIRKERKEKEKQMKIEKDREEERKRREKWEAERPKREKRRAEKAKRLKELYNAANKDQSFCDKHPKKCSTKTYWQAWILDYEEACNNDGDMVACGVTASMYKEGVKGEIPKDINKAAELYAKSCTGGQPWNCWELGELANKGQFGNKNDAQIFFKTACALGKKDMQEHAVFWNEKGRACQEYLK